MLYHVEYPRIVVLYPEDEHETSSKHTVNENTQTHIFTKIKHNYS